MRARSQGDSWGFTGSDGQNSLNVHRNSFQLTPCDSPDLCTAVLGTLSRLPDSGDVSRSDHLQTHVASHVSRHKSGTDHPPLTHLERNTAHQTTALAGRASLRDGQPTEQAALGRVADRVWHPVDLPSGLPHGAPGAELPQAITGRVEGCPRDTARSDSVRSTGCHTAPSVQDQQWLPASEVLRRSMDQDQAVSRP